LSQQIKLTPVSPGVFEHEVLTLRIRVIVVNQLPQEEQNAMLHLLSASEDLIQYGNEHYHPHSKEISTLLYHLLRLYNEDESMSEKMKEYLRQSVDSILKSIPPEERLKGMTTEERLKGMTTEERLKGTTEEELLKLIPLEERLKGLSTEDVLKALPPEILEQLAHRLKNDGQS
jgi:hypothetical protein